MSACADCLEASFQRARLIATLEESGAAPRDAGELLGLDHAEAFRLVSSGGMSHARQDIDAGSDVWTVCRHDTEFPRRLTAFHRESDIPYVLYGVGDRTRFDGLANTSVAAIVGARRASAYGREVAYSLGHDCARDGITVISGMALGIDGAAHRGGLQAGGPTIAVLAGGPERPYPRSHRLLYEQILERGCVVSESPPGTEARRWSFVARNRIIAGLSDFVVFVEGDEKSGARHTLAFADELGVQIGVVPGPVTSPMSAGPNARLGEDGVVAVRGVNDLRRSLELEFSEPLPTLFASDEDGTAGEILAKIAAGERSPRALSQALPRMSTREITRTLGDLELRGLVRRTSSGEYERA